MPQKKHALSALLALLLSSLCSVAWAQGSFKSVEIGTQGTPRGYWEFLPTAYASSPNKKFPLVIFFHGLGEGGNGKGDLSKITKNGPPKLLSKPAHPVYGIIDQAQAIVLSPQTTTNTWWKQGHIRPFLDWAKTHYRIDPDRIYFTGLSAGASGIAHFINTDPKPGEIAAALVVAVRGKVDENSSVAGKLPFWALTAKNDGSSEPVSSVNRLAGAWSKMPPTNVMKTYPGDKDTQTATFSPAKGWVWTTGTNTVVASTKLALTLYPGGNHNSWDRTYDNPQVWQWLFAQTKKGTLPPMTPDMGAMDADMAAPPADMGDQTDMAPASVDMSAAASDMDTTAPDASPSGDLSAADPDMKSSGAQNDLGSTMAADMGPSQAKSDMNRPENGPQADANGTDDEGCATAQGQSRSPSGSVLLLLLGIVGMRLRRRIKAF